MPGDVHVQGRNGDVDIGYEDIWDGGGDYSWPTVAQVHDIASTDAADDGDPVGTGARTLRIRGLDVNWLQVDEDITLNGTTNVPTTTKFLRINQMFVLTGGSGGSNAGTITATGQVDSTVTSQITIGYNESMSGFHSVPAGDILRVTTWHASINHAAAILEIQLKVRLKDSVFRVRQTQANYSLGSAYFQHYFQPVLYVPPKSDVIVRGTSSAANAVVMGGFEATL